MTWLRNLLPRPVRHRLITWLAGSDPVGINLTLIPVERT